MQLKHHVDSFFSPKLANRYNPHHPLCFVLLHGFLAHSGTFHSFNQVWKKSLTGDHNTNHNHPTNKEIHNVRILTVDARNHGLSPHTASHNQSLMTEDLTHFLSQQDLYPNPNHHTVVAVGHSMGSGTWTKFLLDEKEKVKPPIAAFLSMDMPPITGAELSPTLRGELGVFLDIMKHVKLERVTDYRSGQEAFELAIEQCLPSDQRQDKKALARVKGFLSTNLRFTTDSEKKRVARWKCHVPVLEKALKESQLFLDAAQYSKETCQGGIAVPVLSLLGGDSPIGGQPQYRGRWPHFVKNANDGNLVREVIIPNATHTIYFDQPEATVTAINTFLEDVGVF
ncbi:Alpha/beta hydrolase family/Serine aminopeptidase, S33, putative [Angomonas deanei]|uniref:Alpha/beta hydrolase family/Serine aminopeptidase, S33, putative n=1 Tax=Angomonas deanei TaxID=59799 RepID=A0A7G2C6I9_9TRYP|nr:Alpha/beta hydrolase family/Serine aminopeptidase, S33, putative [Angomonas deanei]